MEVLIADDDPVSRRLLEDALARWGYTVKVARDGGEAWELLRPVDAPRLAILDWMMPGLDGLEVCRRVRERAYPYTYLVLLTARDRQEDLVAALDGGADEFLTKPFAAAELRARLRTGERILDLYRALMETQEALRYEATHDALTGVHNRRTILEGLRRELDRSARERRPFGVVMADVDHFKAINDSHGHATGDAVLREVAARLRRTSRPYDAVGRYGGEEFLLVLPGCGGVETIAAAERLRAAVVAQPIEAAGAIPVTVSFGAVGWQPGMPEEVFRLVGAADAALYRAKRGGRNRVEQGHLDDTTPAEDDSA